MNSIVKGEVKMPYDRDMDSVQADGREIEMVD